MKTKPDRIYVVSSDPVRFEPIEVEGQDYSQPLTVQLERMAEGAFEGDTISVIVRRDLGEVPQPTSLKGVRLSEWWITMFCVFRKGGWRPITPATGTHREPGKAGV